MGFYKKNRARRTSQATSTRNQRAPGGNQRKPQPRSTKHTTITRRTGNATLDRSVQTVLNRVKRIGKAFPSSSNDRQRTFVLDFTPRLRN